jgi:hypothetical protein
MTADNRSSGMPREKAFEGDAGFGVLVAQVRAGSDDAAETLYKRHFDEVIKIINDRFCGRGNTLRRRFDTTDLSQDVWRMVFSAIKTQRKSFACE